MRYDPPLHKTAGLRPLLTALALLVLYPLFVEGTYFRHIVILTFIFAIVATSWDLSLGFGGLFNFAHLALFAVGIYTYAIFTKQFGLSPWLAIPLGGLVAVLFALIISLPILRLDGIYVILVTIALSQLLYLVIISWSDITGGSSGMVTLPVLTIDGYRLNRDGRIGYYFIGLSLLCANLAFLYWFTRSRWGRAIVALRDNKYYAIARGVSESKTRAITLMASALFTGVAGAFYASYLRVASPDAFSLSFLTLLLSILLVGGSGTLWGPVIAAFVISIASEWLANLGAWREIIIATSIILVVVFYPGGLWAAIQEIREALFSKLSLIKAKQWRSIANQRTSMTGLTEQFIDTEHGSISVIDNQKYELPALLFIHGNSACKEIFFHQYLEYDDKYRVIAFDLPGHGASSNADPEKSYHISAYAAVAEQILTSLNVHNVAVFGWSLGGYIAIELAARGNVQLSALAISGTAPIKMVPDDMARGYNAQSEHHLAGKAYFSSGEEKRFFGAITGSNNAHRGLFWKSFTRTDGRARQYLISKLATINWPRQMRVITEGKVPMSVLNGRDDPFLNHSYIAALNYANLWAGSPKDISEGGHAPFLNQPDKFNQQLSKFLSDSIKHQ